MADEQQPIKPVNLPFTPPDLVGEYRSAYAYSPKKETADYQDVFQNLLNTAAPKTGSDFPAVPTAGVDFSGRYPLYFPGRDNEEMYAQSQGTFDKMYNGVVKMAGNAGATFINGTAGLVYGIFKSVQDQKFSSFYDNELTRSLNEYTTSLEDTYAHYKTERERNGSWWEPANLFTGNFLWDNIVKNLGFSIGAFASGFAWGGALKALGATSRIMGAGAKMASRADAIISEASILPQAERLATINSRLSGLAASAQKSIGLGLMQADRAIVATFGTAGEAGLESLNNSQDFRQQMIDNFKATRGYDPTPADLQEINRLAESVGNWSYLGNSALLTATNYIQLPRIFSSSFKSDKDILNKVAFKEGKYVSTLPEKGFGKRLYGAGKAASLLFNTAEAFEEGAQYAIQTGTQNYFSKKAKGEKPSVTDDAIFFGLNEALTTDEGLLNVFTGGFAGALQSAGFVGVKGGLPVFGKTGKIGERGVFGFGGEQGKLRDEAVTALNNSLIKDKMKSAYSNLKAAEIIQEEREAAIRRGDILEAKDLEFDYAHTFIETRLKYRAKEAVDYEINDLRNQALSDGGFLKLQQEGYAAPTDTQPSFIKRLDNLQAHANVAAKLDGDLKIKYGGVVGPNGERTYTDDVISKMVYAGSKIANYDQRISDVNQTLGLSGVNTSEILESVGTDGKPSEEAIKDLAEQINTKPGLTDDEREDLKTNAKDLTEMAMRKKAFIDEYNDIKLNPAKYKTGPAKAPEGTKDKGAVTVDTQKGEIKFETGKEYYIGVPVKRTKKGVKHEMFSRFIVLGESPDGKLVLQVSSRDPKEDGEIFTVKKDFFDGQDIEEISAVENKPNAKFYTEVAGNVFTYQLGRGKTVQGNVRYEGKTGKLVFVTLDGKKKYNVTRDMFVVKEGYEVAKIYSEEELSDRAKEALTAKVGEDELSSLYAERDAILAEAVQKVTAAREEVDKKLEDARATLQKADEEIKKITTTKKGEPKKQISKAQRKVLENLRRTYIGTEDAIKKLEEERDELEQTRDYLKSLYDQRENLPDTFDEAIKDLKAMINDTGEVIKTSVESLDSGYKLLESIDSAIQTAMSLLNDYITRLREENPNLPLYLEDLQNRIEPYLGEQGAKNYIQEKLGLTETVMELEDQISEFAEELKIPDMTKRAEKLEADIKDIQEGLEKILSEREPKLEALQALEKTAEEYRKRVAEEEQIARNQKLIKRFLKTADDGVQTEMYEYDYEPDPKKPDLYVVTGTTAPSEKFAGGPLADHHVRANRFAANMDKMPNRENLRGIIVTSKNEGGILPGLTQFLKDKGDQTADTDPKETIALVIVEIDPDDESVKRLVGIDGKPLASKDLNAAIFQVFPNAELKWSNNDSMFRKDTPTEVVEELTKQYDEWRTQTLNNPSTDTYSIDASFGIPEVVGELDEKNNFVPTEDAVTSVQDAGLITNEDLVNRAVVEIPTSEGALDNGSVSFSKPLGKPFLILKNGYVKLKNRLLTKQEAATVYQAIERLVTAVHENEDGIDSDDAQRMLSYLRSIVYWGVPKDNKPRGQNSVFFLEEDVEGPFKRFTLNIGAKDYNIPFTPTAVRAKKDEIISLLEGLYNNINSKLVDTKWSQPFTEVLSISPQGEMTTREWPNYQSYLLSNRLPGASGQLDGEARNSKELPLYTQMRPLRDTDDVNRKGIYFIVDHGQDKFKYEKTSTTKKKKIKPGKLGEKEEKGEKKEKQYRVAPPGKFILDGETLNIFTTAPSEKYPKGRKIYFVANRELILKKDVKNGIKTAFGVGDAQTIQEELISKGMTKEETLAQFRGNIFNAIKGELVAKKDISSDTETVIEDDTDEMSEDVASSLFGVKPKAKKEEEEEEEIEIEEETEEENGDDTFGDFNIEDDDDLKDDIDSMDDDVPFRLIIEEQVKKFEGENWKKAEAWLSKYFSNIPVYRVKNVLQSTNGVQAWGMFKDGAIYIYGNAEVGTVYHEVFHAVWRMFSDPEERQAIINELRSRKGTFYDRKLGEDVSYTTATERQLEEALAEEFRDYVQKGKIPARPTQGKNFIQRLFADLVNFIKEFFTGEKAAVNTANLFEKINTGYYNTYSPYHTSLSYAKMGIIDIEEAMVDDGAALDIANFTGQEVNDIMQEMTYQTLGKLIKTNKSLFEVPNLDRQELYEELRVQIRRTVTKLYKANLDNITLGKYKTKGELNQAKREMAKSLSMRRSIMNDVTWSQLVNKHEEYLRKYSIEFDENDVINLTADENTGKGEYDSADKIDHFKKANAAIKLILSTVPLVKEKQTVSPNGRSTLSTEYIPSSIGGHTLLPTIEVFIKIMNQTHDSANIEDMLNRIKQMAKGDPNYRTVYTRLTRRNFTTPGIDLSNLKETHDADLLTALWTTFKKQNPDVKNHYIRDNGEVQIGDANLATAARQAKQELLNDMVKVLRGKNPYFKEDKAKQAYIATKGAINRVELNNMEDRVKFLRSLGIKFKLADIKKLSKEKQEIFRDAVGGLKTSLKKADRVSSINSKTLNIDGRLMELGEIKSAIENPEFDSTYIGGSGERKQTYIGTNAASDLYDALTQVDNFYDIPKKYPQYAYLITDSFAQNSVIINRMFDLNTGKRKADAQEYMKVSIADSTIDTSRGKSKESSRLNYRERFIQEINMNLAGYYLNLVPGDASLEHMMKMGNAITEDMLLYGRSRVHSIFEGYFTSEVDLSREKDRHIADVKGRNKKDLRFFKPILGKELHDEITSQTKNKTLNKENSQLTSDQLYKKYENQIVEALDSFINKQSEKLKETLSTYNIIEATSEGWILDNLDFPTDRPTKDEMLKRRLDALTVNYMINNIELHKILYSDPYQYADELKRIKNFLSPRQAIMYGSKKINSILNDVYNKGYDVDDIGRTDFGQDFFRSITLGKVFSTNELPLYDDPYEEADGGGIIMFKAYRNFRIRSNNWNKREESQYRYDIAWEKRDKKLKLSANEVKILEKGNPRVKSAYTTLKPIVAGNKGNGRSFNDVLLDKFALYPLSYRMMKEFKPNSNAVKLYNKMQKEDVDYAVFESGRKVGAEKVFDIYDSNGNFNSVPFETQQEIDNPSLEQGVLNVPFAIMSVQAEVPSKEDEIVTRGSQVTKLVTLDMMEAGMPVDFQPDEDFETRYNNWVALEDKESYNGGNNLYKEIKRNEDLLVRLIEEGYEQLLDKFGIKETFSNGAYSYTLDNIDKTVEVLEREVLNREVNDNVLSALRGLKSKEVVLEATPAYQLIRNILYSIADKNVISQKISGGQKVQLPVTLLESKRAEAKQVGDKTVYASDELKFYVNEKGERVCELYVARWFKSDLSDKELLKALNQTKEGQEILRGIAYRIPTQKQNSIDVFVIKDFLPQEFGDNVFVPSALVKKVGSDFDIDKLSMYLKNIYLDRNQVPKLIKLELINTNSESQLRDFYENNLLGRYKKMKEIEKEAAIETAAQDLLESVLGVEDLTESLVNDLKLKYVPSIDEFLLEAKGMDPYELNKKYSRFSYKKLLENAYIDSLEKLVTNELNFESLVKPNSADQLKDLSKKIVDKLGLTKFDYTQVDNMLDRVFMSNLRHAFVTGKYAIGIAAVNQTNHSLNQRSNIFIDDEKLEAVSLTDRSWLKDGKIKFFKEDGTNNFNTVKIGDREVVTLSMIKNKAGQFISDIIGQFIDGYVDIAKGPWIMQMGATPNVASTYLFLTKIGVPIDSVVFFMNQPIIRDYLRTLENEGYTWVFNGKFVNQVKNSSKYKVDENKAERVTAIPIESKLEENLGKQEFDANERAEQHFILDEFLKYAKMGEHLFRVTQGTNYDTSNFNDPLLVFKKEMQLINARETIISSVDKVLDNSFLKRLRINIGRLRNAYAEVFMSDKPKVRNIVQKVLLPYVNLSDREFVKVAQKVVADLFDWAVQNDFTTKSNVRLNTYIEKALLADDNYVRQIDDFLQKIKADENHPLYNNLVIKALQPVLSDRVNGVDNLKMKGRDGKLYDQNQIIYDFKKLKSHLAGIGNEELFNKIVTVAVLQSGLSNSPISFTSLLPYDDFKRIYNPVLSNLENVPNLDLFYKLNVFERNNWNNDDIIPHSKAKLFQSKDGNWFYNTNINFLPKDVSRAVKTGQIPQVMTMPVLSREGTSDFIVYSWEDESIPLADRQAMKRKGDFSFMDKGLFKKVRDAYGNPLIHSTESKGKVYENFVYQAINAWGDSFRANEFYANARKSKIDNGFIKVKEVAPEKIIPYFVNSPALESFKERIVQDFPTMEIDELTVQLKDGNYYLKDQITADFLERLGYTRAQIGEILTKLC
jgi:hypothetical protein